jgi:anthranilate/para-aminobenzoate synthase component I
MYSPDLEAFSEMIEQAGLVPLHRTIVADLDTPLTIFAKVAEREKHAFLFESMEGGEKWGRYSFIGLDPLLSFSSVGDVVTLRKAGFGSEVESETEAETDNPNETKINRGSDLALNGSETYWLDGNHENILDYPTVKSLAEKIDICLNKLQK